MAWETDTPKKLEDLIQNLHNSVQGLDTLFADDKRRFALDGHLLGSIGEVVAKYMFNLELHSSSNGIHDGQTVDTSKQVQIKITGGKKGVSFRGNIAPDYLIVLQLTKKDFIDFEIIYNGPGQVAWDQCGKPVKEPFLCLN